MVKFHLKRKAAARAELSPDADLAAKVEVLAQ
jgi:hypothetical protein